MHDTGFTSYFYRLWQYLGTRLDLLLAIVSILSGLIWVSIYDLLGWSGVLIVSVVVLVSGAIPRRYNSRKSHD